MDAGRGVDSGADDPVKVKGAGNCSACTRTVSWHRVFVTLPWEDASLGLRSEPSCEPSSMGSR
jgi:hypothetical protein